jgi:hypothetical protein
VPRLGPLFGHDDRDLERVADEATQDLADALRNARTKAKRAAPAFVRARKVKPRRVKPSRVPPRRV